ncbi:MAG: glycosyltransferase family 2 protein [Saprospiraceae bacterium]|nr:glycosyltransferase family 2 protein [Saprospiraceae bacterium]MBK8668467.1 glycosyltransferase family 2 protein [Saprospiraceae bacterium]
MQSLYSAVVIAKNEAHTIGKCIQALWRVTNDIVIVLDDRSDDNTADISTALGARVYKKKWEGYSANKNFGVDLSLHDWIICVDADEVINDRLVENLLQLHPDLDSVYEMNIRTWFGDYPVKYCGWFPDWNIRLFNKKVMQWNDNFVHEKLVSHHPLNHVKLSGIVEHFSFRDEEHMISKFDYYARLRAEEWKKSSIKPSVLKQYFGPAFRFFRTYILKLGILDGHFGFVIAKNEYKLKKNELKYWRQLKKS